MGWEFIYIAYNIIRKTGMQAVSNKVMKRIVPSALKLTCRYWKPLYLVHVYLV